MDGCLCELRWLAPCVLGPHSYMLSLSLVILFKKLVVRRFLSFSLSTELSSSLLHPAMYICIAHVPSLIVSVIKFALVERIAHLYCSYDYKAPDIPVLHIHKELFIFSSFIFTRHQIFEYYLHIKKIVHHLVTI